MYIHVKAYPKSKKENLELLKDGYFEICIKEPAEKNLANKRIVQMLKDYFPNNKNVRIISGHHSLSKLVSVDFEE